MRGAEQNLKRRKLSGGCGLFEKLRGGVEEIGPATHVLLGRHSISSEREGKGLRAQSPNTF